MSSFFEDPAWRQTGGKETGAVRKRFFGNTEIAQRFMGPARLLLRQLQDDMSHNGLAQGLRRLVIPINQRVEIGPELSKEGDVDIARRFVQVLGTVAIVAYSSHGQSEVLIDARAINTTEVATEVKVPTESLYLPYFRVRMRQYSDLPGRFSVFAPYPYNEGLDNDETFSAWSTHAAAHAPNPIPHDWEAPEPGFGDQGTWRYFGKVIWPGIEGSYDPLFYCYTRGGMFGGELRYYGYMPPDIEQSLINYFPESMKESVLSVNPSNPTSGQDADGRTYVYTDNSVVVLDPEVTDLPVQPEVYPGWYIVRPSVGTNQGAPMSIEVELGRPTVTYAFEITEDSISGTSMAVLVDVQNGVIALIDLFFPAGHSIRPEHVTGPPDLTGARVQYHPHSPIRPPLDIPPS